MTFLTVNFSCIDKTLKHFLSHAWLTWIIHWFVEFPFWPLPKSHDQHYSCSTTSVITRSSVPYSGPKEGVEDGKIDSNVTLNDFVFDHPRVNTTRKVKLLKLHIFNVSLFRLLMQHRLVIWWNNKPTLLLLYIIFDDTVGSDCLGAKFNLHRVKKSMLAFAENRID